MRKSIKFFLLLALINIICIAAFWNSIIQLLFPRDSVPAVTLTSAERSTVSIVQSEKESFRDITEEDIRQMVSTAVELAGGLEGVVTDNSTVVIKPNLVATVDGTQSGGAGKPLSTQANGVTTDWRVVKAVVELVRELDPHGTVYVMEGSAQGNTLAVMKNFNYTPESIPGVDEFIAIESDSGGWHEYNSPGLVKVALPNGMFRKEYYLNRKYFEADTVISVPCLKDHWHAAVTGGIKNVSIGASPANIYGESGNNAIRISAVNHESTEGELHEWIRDFYLCRPVDFVIMDGIVGIQNGPIPGLNTGTDDISKDEMNMRMILAGRDAIAVDTIEALAMNWDPESVKYLELLGKDHAGNNDTSLITVEGAQVDEVRKDFAGVTPPGGGEKVIDKNAPKTSIKSCNIKGGVLALSLETEADTVKAEVYMDGKRLDPVITSGFDNISIKANIKSGEKHIVRVDTFDRLLNRTGTVIELGG